MRILILAIGVLHLSLILAESKSDYDRCSKYLTKFGWMNHEDKSSNGMQNELDLPQTLKEMQKFFGLNETGLCDNETITYMNRRRCGNSDISFGEKSEKSSDDRGFRKKRFVIFRDVPRWNKFPLTVGYKNYHDGMTRADQDDALLYCASRWAEVSGLSFTLTFGQPTANLFIKFVPSIGSNRKDRFDILAKAESPAPFDDPAQSNIEFDETINWVPKWTPDQSDKTESFQATLCHEMGHSLGLDHTDDQTAIMFAESLPATSEVILAQDDINGIVSLYGGANGQVISNQEPALLPGSAPVPPQPFASSTGFRRRPSQGRRRCSNNRSRKRRQACPDEERPQRRRRPNRRRPPQGRRYSQGSIIDQRLGRFRSRLFGTPSNTLLDAIL